MKLLLVALVAGSRKLCDTTSSLYIAGCSSEVIVAYIMVAVFVKMLLLVALILDRVSCASTNYLSAAGDPVRRVWLTICLSTWVV